MPESELLNQILSDYICANPTADKDHAAGFCVYIAGWLVEHPVIGVGMTADGMALRLADGREMTLVVNPEMANPATVTAPVNITTGASGGAQRGAVSDSTSVSITKG